MNVMLIGLLGTVLAFGAGTWYGTGLGEDREYAKRAREDKIVEDVAQRVSEDTAKAIAKIKVRNTIIKQEIEREIRTDVRYVDCTHTDRLLSRINEALTGRQDIGDSKLPGAIAPIR